ncbi:hypothetical protein [Mycoplasmopsis cynos]|uniref:Uncharacterized protein n=1 Tax=Mycoplasmopsis cynos TaxID=171284 RepID=A0ABD8AJW1_9BACT|nr:hypothetical protein [Mycoplasmopsis cynos]MCU9935599.1 hypothetical protein [Mycoplasmopsis cynos]UWV80952.1 hypothetical protein NW069_02330 [Mycoplasmopsis cynos]UWV85882.1 hypothetical protein NW063_03285 [Mycoplasmopsis cynos]WAM05672.1 hypothetical protein OM999_00025 [Mycoplasmopsis cynos]WAM09037.1 hypothetical protein ONA03_01520 [Mycoplasmopsis cynos]
MDSNYNSDPLNLSSDEKFDKTLDSVLEENENNIFKGRSGSSSNWFKKLLKQQITKNIKKQFWVL